MKKSLWADTKDSELRTLNLNLDGIKKRQQARIRELEEKEQSYLESPAMTFKILALELLKEGDIEKGIEFIDEAVDIDKSIFNDCEYIPVSCHDLKKLSKINRLLPRAALIPAQAIPEGDKAEWARYYKDRAIELLAEKKIFGALRHMEESLKADPVVMELDGGVEIPHSQKIYFFQFEDGQVGEEQKLKSILPLCLDFLTVKMSHHNIFLLVISKISMLSADRVDILYLEGGHTLLLATYHGLVEVVKLLLANNLSINERNECDWTALHIASAFNHFEIVELLLDKNADINAKDNKESTALHFASGLGFVEVVTLLLDGNADINETDQCDRTALHNASWYGRVEVVKLLVDRGADINPKNMRGETALHHASQKGLVEAAKLLIDKGADVNAKDDRDQAPLHLACSNGHVDIAKLLVAKGADVNAKDHRGWTVLHQISVEGGRQVYQNFIHRRTDVGVLTQFEKHVFNDAADSIIDEIIQFLVSKNATISDEHRAKLPSEILLRIDSAQKAVNQIERDNVSINALPSQSFLASKSSSTENLHSTPVCQTSKELLP